MVEVGHANNQKCSERLTMNEIVLRQTLCMMNIILDVIFK
jgi:hypothetical protein